jgi:hypothetical protein
VQRPLPPSRVRSSTDPLCSSPAPSGTSAVSLSASSFVHVIHTEGEGAALAPRLFSLLQLQLRSSLLHTSPNSAAAAPSQWRLPRDLTCGPEQASALLRQLHSEVDALGDQLLLHYQSQAQAEMSESCKRSDASAVRRWNSQHHGRGSSGGNKEGRAPVQLMAMPSDVEQTWLQPMQLHAVHEMLAQLVRAENLHRVILSKVCFSKEQPSDARATNQPSSSQPSQMARGAQRNDTIGEANEVTESRIFYEACTRVAATLAALLGPCESDAQPLACLTHVLQASARADVPVSVTALIDAVSVVQRRREVLQRDSNSTTDVQSSSDVGVSPSEAPLYWCSCVPWLLHRYAVTHPAAPGAHEKVDWATASAWMTLAADRVCATQGSELLSFSSSSGNSPSRLPLRGSAAARGVSAGMFGPWQRVLDQEASDTPFPRAGVTGASACTSSVFPALAADGPLQAWLVESDTQKLGANEALKEGSLQPYWTAVIREMRNSGAHAMDVLVSSVLSASSNAQHTQVSERSNTSSHPSNKHRHQHLRQMHSPSAEALLGDLRFHAIGAYVSLRRITSSLQRHRRLVPLLQLHSLVSGYQPSEHAQSQAFDSSNMRTAALKALRTSDTAYTARNCENHVAAAVQRRRVLTGELMGIGEKRGKTQTQQRRHNDGLTASEGKVHQVGAMLWREVALLDAYTLITLGHVSENAVDTTLLEKSLVLRQLSWLQQECIEHLRTLEGPSPEGTLRDGAVVTTADPTGMNLREAATAGSHRLSRARTKVLLSSLTPRTRATLVEKLREGLRLSAKVLARWGEAAMICCLYRSYPAMGASWEVGRALLQCGHYEAAVRALKTLLETSASAVRGSSSSPPPSSSSSAASAAALLSSSAVAVRQLLLEAVQGAASALVVQQQQQQQRGTRHQPHREPPSCPSSSMPLSAPLNMSSHANTTEEDVNEVDAGVRGEELEAPLPAELRAQLRSLYTHSASLPVPLPLCLHAIMEGLAKAVATAPTLSSDADLRLPSATGGDNAPRQQLPWSGMTTGSSVAVSPEEELRRIAVLCTYVLRCHLVEQPLRGLLSKTVELWASWVARYLCRSGRGAASAGSLKLSMTDCYLREVTVRLLYGYPQVPVARLLLTRLLQQWSVVASAPVPLLPTSDTSRAVRGSCTDDDDEKHAGHQERRATATAQWLLRHFFHFAGGTGVADDALQKAYPVCTPDAAICTHREEGTPWWNADFTERYAQDTLRCMPRIALDSLAYFLKTREDGSLHHVLERVQVALRHRASQDESLRQPWQCSTCFLWNGRYASECKRCRTLATSLLQCRRCNFFTSSALYCATHGLSCDVCGAILVEPTTASFEDDQSDLAFAVPPSDSSTCSQLGEESTNDESSDAPPTPHSAARRAAASVGAATVTGNGRPASVFKNAPNVLRVVPLRPWTCTHCRTDNEAQHVFFCRSCGRPPATDTTKHDAAAAVTGGEAVPCGHCGHVPKTMEDRLSPWCGRCGSLRECLQCLLCSPAAPSSLQCDSGAALPHSACGPLRSPTLWWCAECAVSLNPWTRTHCSLCGAGRPASAPAALVSGMRRVAGTPRLPSRQDRMDTPPGASCDEEGWWQYSTASPFITVPWTMQVCVGCQAQNRVGSPTCWRCGAEQELPASVKQSIGAEWQRWLTQVTHVVTVAEDDDEYSSQGKVDSEAEKTQRPAPSTTKAGACWSVPLLLPCRGRWVCLRDGCLHLNSTDAARRTEGVPSSLSSKIVCCAACNAPCRHAEVFNPFYDRFCWRNGNGSGEVVNSSHAWNVAEALRLPQGAPYPAERLVVTPEMATAGSPSFSSTGPEARRVRVLRCVREASAAAATCVCCGASDEMTDENSVSTPPSSSLSQSQVLQVQPLFLVTVCRKCGHCSRGRSCVAYEQAATDGFCPSSSASLLPGEEALALRLLLRSLTQSVQQALSLEEARRRRGVRSEGGERSLPQVSGTQDSPLSGCTSPPQVDWAWLSRHVISAVRLFHSGDETASCATSGTNVISVVESDDTGKQRAAALARLHDALLPWRGCDVASAQQLCSAQPHVAVLGDAANTVHSALADVRAILESICGLVELRVAEETPRCSRAPRRVRSAVLLRDGSTSPSSDTIPSVPLQQLPPCLQDAWTRRLLRAALDLIDVVNRSTVCDEIGFPTLRRLCRLLRPHEGDDIDTETKWCYLQEMKLTRHAILHHCVQCERCLTNHGPGQPCSLC